MLNLYYIYCRIILTTMQTNFRILIADDHSIVRQGIAIVLKNMNQNLEIKNASDFGEVELMLKNFEFDLIVLDINIPLGKGTQMIEIIKCIQPLLKTLIFSAYDEEVYAPRYLKAGADGYLNKLSTDDEIKFAFQQMITKGNYTSDKVMANMYDNELNNVKDNPIELLSVRELEIARLLISGDGNLEILNKLNIKNSTVSTYKNRIYSKLNVANTVALVALFNQYDEKVF